jgi:hypothetical protein
VPVEAPCIQAFGGRGSDSSMYMRFHADWTFYGTQLSVHLSGRSRYEMRTIITSARCPRAWAPVCRRHLTKSIVTRWTDNRKWALEELRRQQFWYSFTVPLSWGFRRRVLVGRSWSIRIPSRTFAFAKVALVGTRKQGKNCKSIRIIIHYSAGRDSLSHLALLAQCWATYLHLPRIHDGITTSSEQP